MRIREGDPLEIFTDREGEVIFKKYSPIGELGAFAAQYAETLHKTCGLAVVICDRDGVIACSGVPKKDFIDRRLSSELESIIENRSLYIYKSEGEKLYVTEDNDPASFITCAMPIITEGDITGCVAAVSSEGANIPDVDVEQKLIQTAAIFLGRQLES